MTRTLTQVKQPDQCFLNNGLTVMTALEVAWQNENVPRLADAGLFSLLAVTKQAALKVLRGEREGPISVGMTTSYTFDRLRAELSPAYRLSWGLSPSLEDATRVGKGGGRFGLVLFWGDPSPVHEDTILWLRFKVKEQLSD